MTRIRILMPVFNTSPHQIDEAVDSIVAQKLADWELVVVDDGSTNSATVEKVDSLPDRDSRIRVRRQDNAGPAAARNTAAEGARAPFFLALDADDQILPYYLLEAVEVLESDPDVGIVTARGEFFGDRTGEFAFPPYDLDKPFEQTSIANQSVFRRELFEQVGGFAEEMRDGTEDYEFFLRMIDRTRPGIRYLDTVGYRYRISGHSRTTEVLGDLEKLYRSKAQIILRNPEYFSRHIDAVYAEQVAYRLRLRRWFQRYGRFEALLNILHLRKKWPVI